MKLVELLKKAPQSVKDKYNIEVRKLAIENVKKKIIKLQKTLDDFSDDEMEVMINEAANAIDEKAKVTLLTTLLIAAGVKLAFFT